MVHARIRSMDPYPF
jgi:hypothetical protein